MGLMNHLLVALPGEGKSILSSDDPSRDRDGFTFRGLDLIKLVSLWALVDGSRTDDRFEARMEAFQRIDGGESGARVDILPELMVTSLASIAAMEDDEIAALENGWFAIDEFKGWNKLEIDGLVRSIGDLAETAQLDEKTLLVYTSL